MSIDAIDEYGQDCWPSFSNYNQQPESDLSKAIFSTPRSEEKFSRKVTFDLNDSPLDQKVEGVFMNRSGIELVKVERTDLSAEVDFSIQWGGSEGTTFSGTFSGSISDDNGNTGTVSITQDSNGNGSASVGGSTSTQDTSSSSGSAGSK